MAEAVLDSSAVLALLREEPGVDIVRPIVAESLLCTVNLTEIISKLIERGASPPAALNIARGLPYQVVPYNEDLASDAGVLWEETRSTGLSLGDRACLALAKRERLPALTTDRQWMKTSIGVEVRLIRSRSHLPD